MGAVFLRELRSYFQSLTGFIFLGLFLLIIGAVFVLVNLTAGTTDFRNTLQAMNLIFLIAVPILTMRLLSEEARQKTDQLLLTSPVSLAGIVTGKYLAALSLFTAGLVVTLLYPALLGTVGLVVRSEILCAYLGVFLLGASAIAVGTFVSALTDNQVSAAFLTLCALLAIWAMDWILPALPRDRVAGLVFLLIVSAGAAAFVLTATRSVLVAAAVGLALAGASALFYALSPVSFDGLIVHVFVWLALVGRAGKFSRGVLAAGPVLYYVSFVATFLLLTVRVIDKRRWA